jgi:hypothetical protein
VPATSAAHNRILFFLFLLQPFTVLMKQTRQAVHAIKQSIFLRCLWYILNLSKLMSVVGNGRQKICLLLLLFKAALDVMSELSLILQHEGDFFYLAPRLLLENILFKLPDDNISIGIVHFFQTTVAGTK